MRVETRGASLVVLAMAALAGCGGSATPRLARSDAAPLISLSHRITAEGACAQARDISALQRDAAALISGKRVPRPLVQRLRGGVNALAARTPPCVPAVLPVTTPPQPKHGHGHDKGHGDNHGNQGGD